MAEFIIPVNAQLGGLTANRHETEYNKLLGDQDFLRQSQEYRSGEQTGLKVAQLRLKCSENVKGDNRAYFLDGYAAEMESAIAFTASLRDDRKGNALVREDRLVLKQAITANKFSPQLKNALTSRIDGAAIYRGMCPFVSGRYDI